MRKLERSVEVFRSARLHQEAQILERAKAQRELPEEANLVNPSKGKGKHTVAGMLTMVRQVERAWLKREREGSSECSDEEGGIDSRTNPEGHWSIGDVFCGFEFQLPVDILDGTEWAPFAPQGSYKLVATRP